jgi:hypothetical protein
MYKPWIGQNTDQLAEARFSLAKALWKSKKDKDRAKQLAVLALEGYKKIEKYKQKEIVELKKWLKK